MSAVLELSIIIPCYNSERNIGRCLESIFDSSFTFDYEVIVVNDNSTDDSMNVLEGFYLHNENLKIYNTTGKTNSGPSSARNLGVEMCSGKYIIFIDSDDCIEPDYLSSLYSSIENMTSDLVVTGYKEKVNAEAILKYSDFTPESVSNVKDITNAVISGTGGMVWGRIYRSEIVKKNGLKFDEKLNLSEDMIFNLDFIKFADKFGFEAGYGYIYDRTDDNGLSKFNGANYFDKQINLLTILEPKLPQLGFFDFEVRDVILRKTFNAYYMMLYKYCEVGLDYKDFLYSFEYIRKINISTLNISGFFNLLIVKCLSLNSPLLSIFFMKTYQSISKIKKIIK